MFFSMDTLPLRQEHPDLVKFILNPEERFISPKYRFFCYYNIEGNPRHKGYSVMSDISKNQIYHLAEIAYPPLGYVWTIGSPPPDPRLTEITPFASYQYTDWIEISMKFPVLPTFLPQAPGDYRSKKEIGLGL